MKVKHLVVAFLCMLGCCACSSPKTEVKSPDGHIKMTLTVDENGTPFYNVSVNDSLLIENSKMGFVEGNGVILGGGFRIEKTTFDSKDETWTQPWGENKTNRNHYNEMAVNLINEDQVQLTLRFRVFNDGVGFRYEYNVPNVDSLMITDELTTFHFRQDGTSWSIPASAETYELLYKQQPISEVETANTPFTFKTADGVYGSIHEAALYDFSEMTLKQIGDYTLKAELTPWPDGIKVRKSNHFTTSWRTIQIAPEAVGLINSSLILNDPCVLETTDWIRPLKYIGVWWGMHLGVETWKMDERHGATTVNAKKYIDFAAANNIEAVLFEGWNEGWESWGGMQNFDFTKPYADFDIDEIVRYAKEKGIEIIGHHETGGNIPNYERQMDHAMQWYTDHSIHILTRSCFGSGKFRVDGRLRQGEFFRRDIRRLLLSRLAAAAAVFAILPIGTFDAFGTFSPFCTFCTLRALAARTFLTFRLLSLLCSFLSFQTIRAFESFSASSTAAVAAFLTVTASAACTAPFVGSAVTILFLRRLIRLG